MGGKNEFDLNRYRIFLKKRINETTTFTARLGVGANDNNGDQAMDWERYYVTTKLPYDITLTAGRQNIDWEGDAGLYTDDDAWIGDFTRNGFIFEKSWGMVDATVFVVRGEDGLATGSTPGYVNGDSYRYGARFNFNVNEQFRVALSGLWDNYDNRDDMNSHTIYGDFEFKFNPSIALKGAYYTQNNDIAVAERVASGEDSPSAWKVIVDAKQDLLKFTSLWLEYGKIGEGFRMYQNSPYDSYGAAALNNRNVDQDTTIIFVRADQKWNDKWSTFVRYFTADFDTTGIDDTKFYTFGVGYQLNPAVGFELSYDKIDYGDNNPADKNSGDDNVVRLRTVVNF